MRTLVFILAFIAGWLLNHHLFKFGHAKPQAAPAPAPALNTLEWRGVDLLGYPALFSQPKPETFTF